jgi:hypothetical protein
MADPIPFPEVPRQMTPRNGFLDLLFGTLFQPLKTFRQASGPQTSRGVMLCAIYSVVLVSIVAAVTQIMISQGSSIQLSYLLPLKIFLGLLGWLWTALTVALAAQAFTGKMQLKTFLRLSGLAFLPGLLLAPVTLLAQGAMVGGGEWGNSAALLYSLPALLVWLWSSLLFTLALAVTYQMDGERVFLFLLVPVMLFIGTFGGILGLMGDFVQMNLQ